MFTFTPLAHCVSQMSWRPPPGNARAVDGARRRAANEQARRVNDVSSLLAATGISAQEAARAVPQGPGNGLALGPCVQRGIAGIAASRTLRTPGGDHFVRASSEAVPPRRRHPPGSSGQRAGASVAATAEGGTTPRDADWSELEARSAAQPPETSALLRLPPELLLLVLELLGGAELARAGGACVLLWMAAGRDELWRPLWARRWQFRPQVSMFEQSRNNAHAPGAAVRAAAGVRGQYGAASLCLVGQPITWHEPPNAATAALPPESRAEDEGPCARAFAASVSLRGGMVVHGGWSDAGVEAMELHNGVLSDVHWLRPEPTDVCNTASRRRWRWFSPQVMGSPPRRSHHVAALSAHDEVVVCGGSDGFHRVVSRV